MSQFTVFILIEANVSPSHVSNIAKSTGFRITCLACRHLFFDYNIEILLL